MLSEKFAAEIDQAIHSIVDTAWKKAQDILKKHRRTLEAMANALLEQETLEDTQLAKIFATLK